MKLRDVHHMIILSLCGNGLLEDHYDFKRKFTQIIK